MDVIITAGTIITMDPERTRAEAVAVSQGRIVAVGAALAPGSQRHGDDAARLLDRAVVRPHVG